MKKIYGSELQPIFSRKTKRLFRKMITDLFIFIFILSNQSCKQLHQKYQKGEYLGVIRLDRAWKEEIPAKKLGDIAGSVHYIVFKNDKNRFFLHPSISYINDNHIIIDDNSVSLYIYDDKGTLQWVLDRKGKGPGEYIQITDIVADANRHLLYVLDNRQLKIISYDLLTGKYIKEIKIPGSSGRFSIFGDGFVLWNPPWGFVDKKECYFLTFIDKAGKVRTHIDRHGNDNNFRGGLLHSAWFYELNGNLYIKDTYNDTVYYVSKAFEGVPHAVISCGKYTLPREKAEDVFFLQSHLKDYISQLFFLETKHYLFFKFFIGKYYLVIYDKQSGDFISKSEGEINKYATLENDLDHGPDFDPWYISGRKAYMLLPVSEFIKYNIMLNNDSKSYSQMIENNNFILMEVELNTE